MKSFTETRIQLKKGDLLYLFSDGFGDQFGGPKGKKFMAKNLKELLLDLSKLPMPEQKEKLIASLNSWIGEKYEQVDDICVFGVKV
jgi:serine phosphatase RsbU (regulator of sigma subunit)